MPNSERAPTQYMRRHKPDISWRTQISRENARAYSVELLSLQRFSGSDNVAMILEAICEISLKEIGLGRAAKVRPRIWLQPLRERETDWSTMR